MQNFGLAALVCCASLGLPIWPFLLLWFGTESVIVRGTVAKMWENEKRLDQLPYVFSIENTFLLYLNGKCASGYFPLQNPSLNRGGVNIN